MMNTHHHSFLGLYRSLLRETRALPTPYLRLFFRVKSRDDVEKALRLTSDQSLRRKRKLLTKGLSRLRNANAGNRKHLEHVLDLAYARKGKLRAELVEELAALPPTASLPPPIIANVEKSRPPVYSPEVTALLTSPYSRITRPLTPKQLHTPPSLPERVNPTSEEALLLGRLSKRREVNARWRYYTNELRKVLPPLEIGSISKSNDELAQISSSTAAAKSLLKNAGLMDQLRAMVGQVNKGPSLPRRQRLPNSFVTAKVTSPVDESSSKTAVLPTRFLRRRFMAVLGRIPELKRYSALNQPAKYGVSISPDAITTRSRPLNYHIPEVDRTNNLWLKRSEAQVAHKH